MNSELATVSRWNRRLFVGLILAGALAAPAGCSDRSELDGLLAPVGPRAVNTVGRGISPSRSSTVRLITGDQVTLSRGEGAEPAVVITPGPGREKVRFVRHTITNGDVTDVAVVPGDAVPLLASGRLDPQLFNVSALVRQGFADGRQGALPLIVTYRAGQVASLAATAVLSRRWLASIQGEALVPDEADPGAFWRTISPADARGRIASAALPDGVSKIWLDARVTLLLDQSAAMIGAPDAWAAGLTGAGVTVAVLDTGIRAQHPDLAGRLFEAVDFTGTLPGADDNVGHGTHVAGIIAGSGAASNGTYRGIAPDASLIVGKVCATSFCDTSDIIAGMEWAAPRARIINMSLGSDAPSDGTDPMSTAIDNLTAQHGSLFVVAAGNSGSIGNIGSPAAANSALTVASVDKTGELSFFSSHGPRVGDYALKPEIAAPGRDIVAARAAGTPGGDRDPVGDGYVRLSGTSMAAPHAAGSAALLAQLHPDWRAERLKAVLTSTARPVEGAPVYGSGVGRVDLGRATTQVVYAASADLTFGLIPWPHEAPPSTRSVTYQNDGDTAVTLALTMSVTGESGAPAPEGLLRTDPSVTVPPQGSATVKVTLTPQARQKGLFTFRLTASDGTSKVESAGLVYQEPESFDLRIVSLDRSGAPADARGYVLSLDRPGWERIDSVDGVSALRLEKGQYAILASIFAAEEFILAPRPRVTLDRDTTVTLDGRLSTPFTVAVDQPSAVPWLYIGDMQATLPGITVGMSFLSDDTIFAVPTDVAAPEFLFNFQTVVGSSPPMAGMEGSDRFIYNLAFPFAGGIPADLAFRVQDRDLAIVHARYHESAEALASRGDFSWPPGATSAVALSWRQPLPSRRLEYYTPGISWESFLDFRSPLNPEDWPAQQLLGARVYQAGHHLVRWNSAPFGPSFGTGGFWGASYRREDTILVYVSPFSPAESEHHAFWWEPEGTTTLSRDGAVIGTVPISGRGVFEVPADPGTYTVDVTGTREVPWATLGTKFNGSWTFRSERAADDDPHLLPLMTVHVSAPVDRHNNAPAGLPFLLSLEVQHQPGTPAPVVSELKLDVSYDDGASWQPAEVFHSDGRPLALVNHPTTPGFVSLRCSARDVDGNAVTHTVLRSYRTQLPASILAD
jgi:subtilisin family serine protease